MRRAARAAAAVTFAGLMCAGGLRGQTAPATVTVRPAPAVPLAGTVAWVAVEPESLPAGEALLGVEGESAGEPLHFAPAGRGFAALVGVPLEGGDSLEVLLRLRWHGRTDTTRVAIAVALPELRSEQLRVAPAMASPDSAALARVDRELAQSREVSRRSHDTPRLWSGPFRVPRPSRITSVYGTAREFNGEVTSRHLGTDFTGKTGAPVRAAGRGVVALVADFYLAGHAVYVDHGSGLVTGYFHLSRIDVAEGDTVVAGQPIGGVGRSGRVTGPHLHWIARYGTITVDPMSLVRLAAAPGEGQ